jgi:DDE superfamily endonuclease
LKAWLGFLDESGFAQRPPIRATWAPRGQTPQLVEPFNWKTLSGIATVLTHPDGHRSRWLLAVHRGSIRSAQVVRFLNQLRRHRRRPVILLWDRLPAHRSRRVALALAQHRKWLRIEWLPCYAPELNPVEPLWIIWTPPPWRTPRRRICRDSASAFAPGSNVSGGHLP